MCSYIQSGRAKCYHFLHASEKILCRNGLSGNLERETLFRATWEEIDLWKIWQKALSSIFDEKTLQLVLQRLPERWSSQKERKSKAWNRFSFTSTVLLLAFLCFPSWSRVDLSCVTGTTWEVKWFWGLFTCRLQMEREGPERITLPVLLHQKWEASRCQHKDTILLISVSPRWKDWVLLLI